MKGTVTAECMTENAAILPPKKERIDWIDSFRAIMILFIVFGHTASAGISKTYVYSFHVPAFLFASGFLFSRKQDDNFLGFVKRKAFSLMIPYYIFSIISILIFAILGKFASQILGVLVQTTDIFPNLLGMLYANGATGFMKWNLPLWYIPSLFAMLLIMYPITGLFSDFASKKDWIRLFSIVVVFLLGSFANFYFFHLAELPFGFENVLYLSFFFLVGYGFQKIPGGKTDQKALRLLFPGCLALIIGFILSIKCNAPVNYVSVSYGSLGIFYITAFISIFGYVCICKAIPMSFLHYTGKNTLPILLMHKFPVLLFQVFLGTYLAKPWLGDFIAFIIAFISCAGCLLAAAIIRKVFPFALGIRSR